VLGWQIPGHWEGNLIMGKDRTSAIGTLVTANTRTGKPKYTNTIGNQQKMTATFN
jgi:IS30 family transposase